MRNLRYTMILAVRNATCQTLAWNDVAAHASHDTSDLLESTAPTSARAISHFFTMIREEILRMLSFGLSLLTLGKRDSDTGVSLFWIFGVSLEMVRNIEETRGFRNFDSCLRIFYTKFISK